MRLHSAILCAAVAAAAPRTARADIYKFQKPDGTVVYTDNLGQLPPDRREYYNKLREEREEQRRQLERVLGKEELARREAEAKKAELARAQMQEVERQKRMSELDMQLKAFQAKDRERESTRAGWQNRMKAAREKLERLLAEFKKASDDYNNIAIKPSFTLLPGEQESMEEAKKRMTVLEGQVDKAIIEVEVTIPEEARKAGIPPGWIR